MKTNYIKPCCLFFCWQGSVLVIIWILFLTNVRLKRMHSKIKMQLSAICILVMRLCPKNVKESIYIRMVIF